MVAPDKSPIYIGPLSGATTPGQSGPGSDGNEGVLRIPQSPVLLEPPHQIVSFHIQDTRCGVRGVLPPLRLTSEIFLFRLTTRESDHIGWFFTRLVTVCGDSWCLKTGSWWISRSWHDSQSGHLICNLQLTEVDKQAERPEPISWLVTSSHSTYIILS